MQGPAGAGIIPGSRDGQGTRRSDVAVNRQQLDRIASGNGFIAALYQSGGSTPKALKLYGID
jgi:hypothetical protein